MEIPMKYQTAAVAVLATLLAGTAWSHCDTQGRKTARPAAQTVEEKAFGKPGNAKTATRTITVDMNDKMRFSPSAISVRQGETVKFVVKNSGKVMHEFVLGTLQELKEHAELMKKHPGMEHDEPYMAHVAPGKTETIVWQFTKAGDFHFGCLLPGHFEAGMVGKVNVASR
jgi:uncharacterized cupredoxin-like copper-binding protein